MFSEKISLWSWQIINLLHFENTAIIIGYFYHDFESSKKVAMVTSYISFFDSMFDFIAG